MSGAARREAWRGARRATREGAGEHSAARWRWRLRSARVVVGALKGDGWGCWRETETEHAHG